MESILHWWNAANDRDREQGFNWYETAKAFASSLSRQYDVPLANVCGIIAALSIQKSWQENKRLAKLYFETGEVSHLTMVREKISLIISATDIYEIADILNGDKTQRFYFNIMGKWDFVTVDRHAQRIAGNDVKRLTTKQYEQLEQQYRQAAYAVGVPPAVLQAVTWCAFRRENGIVKGYGANV